MKIVNVDGEWTACVGINKTSTGRKKKDWQYRHTHIVRDHFHQGLINIATLSFPKEFIGKRVKIIIKEVK